MELLPSEVTSLARTTAREEKNFSWYKNLFEQPFAWNPLARPWGYFPDLLPKHQQRVRKQGDIVKKNLPDRLGVFCDISAGNGNYAFELAARAEFMLLCDLTVNNLNYLHGQILDKKLPNALLCRTDYLRFPVREHSLDTILCTDTLIYGKEHELRLLKSIYSSLKIGGIALVNFSNRRHQLSIFHKPYSIGYSQPQIEKMLRSTGIKEFQFIPYYQELSTDLEEKKLKVKLIKTIIPPTRFFVLLRKTDH